MNLNSLLTWFKGGLNKWRIAFLTFAFVYAAFLLLNLSHMSPQWDEIVNLNGGLFLLRGNFSLYLSWNSFYPPLYDVITAGFFAAGGVSLFTGRLVSVVFSLLSVYAVFEFVYRIYDAKTGLLSGILLAVMPGYVWLSRMAMLEPMLVFFFTVSTLFFFLWFKEHKNKFLALSIATFFLGVATKYQTVIVAVIAVVTLVLLGRDYLKKKFRTFPRLAVRVVAVTVPLALLFYWFYTTGMLNQWLYAMNIGNPDKTLYSTGLGRFPGWFDPLPSWLRVSIFYLIEITEPYTNVHPISFLLYVLGLAGLGLLAWRRKTADKYLLIWFAVVYIFFTPIPNRQWRYLIPAFPVLAISGAILITSALDKARKTWKLPQLSVRKKQLVKVAAGLLVAFTLVGITYSVNNAYSWVAKDQINIPIEQTTKYLASHLSQNQSAVIVCAFNLLDQDMFEFYMPADMSPNQIWQYPSLPVDSYTPSFNVTEFVNLCEQRNVKYIILFDYGANTPFYNTTLTYADVLQMIANTGRFGVPTDQPFFGQMPYRLFLVRFNQTET